jgi:lysophospholipase L1-like esterase
LKQSLRGLGIKLFDTKAHLLDYARKSDTDLRLLYDNDHGHPSEKGNQVIAEGLFNWLQAVEDF